MKTLRFLLLATILCAANHARADFNYFAGMEIRAVNDFYAPLSPYGRWIELPRYGWCWYPTYIDQDWRPYANGNWTWSDQGWYWVSEEPWAWATYHYGRWFWQPYYGWMWMPGLDWAPSWVSWRDGDEYVGWAPLPPECDFGGRDVIYANQVIIAPETFVFVQQRHFCEHIQPSALVFNTTIINQTVNITKIQRINQRVINEGPNVQAIAKLNPGRVSIDRKSIQRPRYVPREERQIFASPSQFQNRGGAGRLNSFPSPIALETAPVSDSEPAALRPDDSRQVKGSPHRSP